MATFFKYAERSADAFVNWAEVGRNMSNAFIEANRIREEKKAALDEGLRQELKRLDEAPTGEFKSANDWTLNYANDAAQTQLIYSRMLRSGQMNLKDYTVATQNLKDDTQNIFATMKTIQDTFKEKAARYTGNNSTELESWLMEQIEGLSQFKSFKPVINPMTGHVTLGKIKKETVDGKEVEVVDENERMTIPQLKNYLQFTGDKYDYASEVDKSVDAIGIYKFATELSKIKGVYSLTSFDEISDATLRSKLNDEEKEILEPYFAFEKDSIESMLVNPFNTMSILTDRMEGYSFTFNAEEAKNDNKKILLSSDGSGVKPTITEEQKKAAYGFLRTQMRNRLDRIVEKQVIAEPQRPSATRSGSGKTSKTKDAANYLGFLYYGSEEEIKDALNYFANLEDVKSVERTPEKVTFIMTNNRIQDYLFNQSAANFIGTAIKLFSDDDDVVIDEAIKNSKGFRENRPLNTQTNIFREQPRPEPGDANIALQNRIKSALDKITTKPTVEDINGIITAIPGTSGMLMAKSAGILSSKINILKGKNVISTIDTSNNAWRTQLQDLLLNTSDQNIEMAQRANLINEGFKIRTQASDRQTTGAATGHTSTLDYGIY